MSAPPTCLLKRIVQSTVLDQGKKGRSRAKAAGASAGRSAEQAERLAEFQYRRRKTEATSAGMRLCTSAEEIGGVLDSGWSQGDNEVASAVIEEQC
ncbi:hypothetical protein MA16_Dca003947 [Dendrobium catenatum]|uniref:Uncharacterized protein n=1 Tax=Dendrobium catenatum TaxID=906689 RepID=A0A2I0X1Z6_9ASPA|nr:hypothetical protein MA16_Dca003947 [Dendrobium catenatum]